MAKQKKKKPTASKIDWRQILAQAAVDFAVGFLLLIAEKLTK